MIRTNDHPKTACRVLFLLAVSLAILGACLVTVQSGEDCEAAEAPSPVAVSSNPDVLQFVVDGIVYRVFGDGVAEVMGFEGYPPTDLVILREVTSPDGREYKVVRVSDGAFRDMAVLESVVIPDTVTEVGRNAFGGCVSLTALTVPVSVGCHHGDNGYAFEDVLLEELTLTRGVDGFRNEGNEFWSPMCGMLRVLVVDDGLTMFTTPFRGSIHLESVTLKDVQSIGEDQFRDCPSLRTVVAPGARTVDDNAFMDCPRLNRVDLSSLESLARGVFVHCSSLRTVVSDLLFIDDGRLFMILDDDSVSLIQQLDADPRIIGIPVEVASPSGRNYAVTEIGKEAFRENGNLRLLVINEDVRKLDEHAFLDCRSLDLITIPIGIDCSYDTGKAAFKGVKPTRLVLTSEGYDPEGYMDNEFWKSFGSSLRALVVSEGITDFATSFKDGRLMTVIMDDVETVYDGQFEGCGDLVVASFPEAVTVGGSAFKDCDKLVTIDVSKAKHIGRKAFNGCFTLGDFVGDSVETVGEKGFYGCVPLAEFNFDNIKKVGSKAFHDTAVMDAPSSKSHCFAKDSFGSSLENVAKFLFKNMFAITMSSMSVITGIATGGSIYSLVCAIKERSAFQAPLDVLKSELQSVQRTLSEMEQRKLVIESKAYPDYEDVQFYEFYNKRKPYLDYRIDELTKDIDPKNVELDELNNNVSNWVDITIIVVVITAIFVGITICLWNANT